MQLDDVKRLCELLDAELARRGKDLSVLAAGGSFEQWLAFEARLLMERERANLKIVQSAWTANEYRKVDLGVWLTDSALDVGIELKLIYNNKNWKGQVNGFWRDLFPNASSNKDLLKPRLRTALVGVVGKTYRAGQGGAYAQGAKQRDLPTWEKTMWRYALPTKGEYANRVAQAWEGRRHRIEDPFLDPSAENIFQLHLLVPANVAAKS